MSDLFHRPEYAREIAASLLRPGPLEQGARSGVFLSGMRRIGKTTFVRQDLMPELCKLGALPIYVDLWADKLRAPSALVHEAVREAVQSLPSGASDWLASLRRRVTGVDVGLGPLKLGVKLDSLGQPGGATLADVFEALVRHTQANVVLIVDEVQHAVGSEDGMHLLHALKAARDRVNTATDLPGKFIFLGTGSHKSLVADMATRRSHPFAGAVGAEFQVLGVDFVQCGWSRLPGTTGVPSCPRSRPPPKGLASWAIALRSWKKPCASSSAKASCKRNPKARRAWRPMPCFAPFARPLRRRRPMWISPPLMALACWRRPFMRASPGRSVRACSAQMPWLSTRAKRV